MMGDMGLDELVNNLGEPYPFRLKTADEFLEGCYNWGLTYKESFDALNSYLEYCRQQEIERARFEANLENLWRAILDAIARPSVEALTRVINWFEERRGGGR